MAKKEQIPKIIQTKFAKPQFKEGEEVVFEWLRQRLIGTIKRIKNETICRYMVEARNYIYPVGLQIKEHKSGDIGNILFEETKERNRSTTK